MNEETNQQFSQITDQHNSKNSMNSHFSNLQRISIEIPGFGYDV
jgi:hypothetical protein